MGTIILHTILTISALSVLCAIFLYWVGQKFKVNETFGSGKITSTLAQVMDDLIQDPCFADESISTKSAPCIRCARCVAVCPAGLEPYLLLRLSEKQLFQRAEQEHVADCTECEFCNEACPSNLPLLDHIRQGKGKQRQEKADGKPEKGDEHPIIQKIESPPCP